MLWKSWIPDVSEVVPDQSIMATKVQQTSHHPFKSLSDSDLSSAAAGVGNLSTSSNGNVERKRVTINDDASTNDSSSTDKSKTLPSKAKQTLTLKRTNSLKRSITLPRWGKTIVCQLDYLKTGFEVLKLYCIFEMLYKIETVFLRNPFVGMAKKSKPSIMKEGVHFEEAKTLQSTATNITSTTATSRNQVWSKFMCIFVRIKLCFSFWRLNNIVLFIINNWTKYSSIYRYL